MWMTVVDWWITFPPMFSSSFPTIPGVLPSYPDIPTTTTITTLSLSIYEDIP
jgi:hypothetical protein